MHTVLVLQGRRRSREGRRRQRDQACQQRGLRASPPKGTAVRCSMLPAWHLTPNCNVGTASGTDRPAEATVRDGRRRRRWLDECDGGFSAPASARGRSTAPCPARALPPFSTAPCSSSRRLEHALLELAAPSVRRPGGAASLSSAKSNRLIRSEMLLKFAGRCRRRRQLERA